MAGAIIGAPAFIEVYLSTTLAVCDARDPKGLYATVRAGEIAEFTGISAPYEEPTCLAVTLDTDAHTLHEAARMVLARVSLR